MHNFQWITWPTQSCLVLYSLGANLQHSLIMWLIASSQLPHNLYLLFCCILSILALTYLILMAFFSSYQKRFRFSLKVFLSWPCPSFIMWYFACLLLEMSIELFFFHFFFFLVYWIFLFCWCLCCQYCIWWL